MRSRLIEGDESIGARFRLRRWALFEQVFPTISAMSVLDLGGTVEAWERAPVRPDHVHVVNLDDETAEAPNWISVERGDACELAPDFAGRGFDLVFSNSVLEHVGGYHRRGQFAAVIRRSATRYWVQTPYRYFPLEPHFLFPGFQFLPVTARAGIAEHWPLSHTRTAGRKSAVRNVLATELVGRTEMAYYFPDSTIHSERIGGITKSLIAIKK